MASSVKNVLDSLTHQVLVESLFGPGCIHLRQLRLQVAIVRVFFFPDYFLACVSCFVSAYSGELWTPLAMILHFLLSPLLNSFPLSFHTQLHQPSAVDHLLCQPFFSPKKKKKQADLNYPPDVDVQSVFFAGEWMESVRTLPEKK